MNVYAELNSGFQQVGGVCPAGWMVMQSDRPSPEHIASEGGTWVVPVPSPDALQAALKVSERAWRDAELTSVTWLRERHRDQQELGLDTTLSAEQFVELLAYMQALRAWPQSSDFPDSAHRPIAPRWIADQTE
ncbi:phage tail assembly chaperone [Pseudomonas sp. P7548]|uniref:phage tail assembly chaperone n=1 Tax=Pseudomonas sp. P7548 TaxID=2726981 RepID=UPI002116EC34|nr:phage tail assembly chaperone [Pseudomonas sp. P7548]